MAVNGADSSGNRGWARMPGKILALYRSGRWILSSDRRFACLVAKGECHTANFLDFFFSILKGQAVGSRRRVCRNNHNSLHEVRNMSTRSQRSKRRRPLKIERLAARQLMAADLSILDEGLQGPMLTSLQSSVNHEVFLAEAPLVGNQLTTQHAGAQMLAELKSDFADLDFGVGVTVESVRGAIESALEDRITDEGVTVSGKDGDSELRFRIPLSYRREATLDADLGLGEDSMVDLLLGNRDAVNADLDIELTLEFGVRERTDGTSEFFLVTAEHGEIRVHVDANLDSEMSNGQGRLGVFLGKFQSSESESSFQATYVIDLQDADGDGILLQEEIEDAKVLGTLDGSAQINLDAEGSFLPATEGMSQEKMFNLSVVTDLTVDYEFNDASTNVTANGSQTDQLGSEPTISFNQTRLDLGSLFDEFIDPLMTSLRDILDPIRAGVDFLTDPLPVIGQYTDETLLTAITKGVELTKDSAQRDERLLQLDRLSTIAGLINRILDYRTAEETESATMGIGNFQLKHEHAFVDDQAERRKQLKQRAQDRIESNSFSFTPAEESLQSSRLTRFKADFGADLKLPLLTDPSTLASLLAGDASATLFQADLNFELTALRHQFTKPIEALAFLANAEFSFELQAGLDLGFGFDAQGIHDYVWSLDFSSDETLEQTKDINRHHLDRGFYVDDNNPRHATDGRLSRIDSLSRLTERPELYVSATVGVGGSLGPDFLGVTAKAGILATLTADFNVDLNDLPDTVPPSQWSDPFTPTRPADSDEWTYDGHIRLHEIRETIEHDPSMLFNANGEISVGARAVAELTIAGVNLFEISHQFAQVPIIDFDIAQSDDAAIIEKNNTGVILGAIDPASGVVNVYAGATAGNRVGIEHSIQGDARNENFRVRRIGGSDLDGRESVQVTYWFTDADHVRRAYSQTFADVSEVVIHSGDGEDQLIAEPNLSVSAVFNAGSGEDVVMGGGGDDLLNGGSGDDQIYGYSGNDTIRGESGNDDLFGGVGDDHLDGGDGRDTVRGEAGNDWVAGGNDRDKVFGGDGNDTVRGGAGDDRLYGDKGHDAVFGDSGDDWLHGDNVRNWLFMTPNASGAGNDSLYGGSGRDELRGGHGHDSANGDSGDDEVLGETGNDTLRGGAGDDTIKGAEGNDSLYGDAGSDTLYGQHGDDTIHGGADADRIFGDFSDLANLFSGKHTGNDRLYGGDGNDTIKGGPGNDQIFGGNHNDSLHGQSGNDVLKGDAGYDTLHGDKGNDRLHGGSHNDRLYGGWGNDRLYGDSGRDRLYGSLGSDYLSGGTGNDYLHGGWGNDRMYGGHGNDSMHGDLGRDYLSGGDGRDYLNGGAGKDRIYGGRGNDTLDGGRILGLRDLTRDYLHGGSGYDTIYAQRYWFFGWKREETVISGERVR